LVLDTNIFLVALLKHYKSKGKLASLKRTGHLLAHGGGGRRTTVDEADERIELMGGLSRHNLGRNAN
jgi:hypothetical protein